MKKKIQSLLLFACVGFGMSGMVACTDFLEQPEGSNLTTEFIFSDPESAMEALYSVYGACVVNGFLWGHNGTGQLSMNGGAYDGLMMATCDEGIQTGNHVPTTFNNGSWGPSNQREFDFSGKQAACRKACVFIDNIDQTPLVSTGTVDFTAKYRDQVKAEARVLRALIHFEMFRRYGGIPLMYETPRVVVTEHDGVNKAEVVPAAYRMSVERTVKFIVDECDLAAPDLPDSYGAAELGRVTKGLALALKARTLLYAASPLYNRSSPLVDAVGADSLVCYGNENRERWKDAADAALIAIEWAHKQNMKLVEDSDVGGRPGEGYAVATSSVVDPRNREVIFFDHSHGRQAGGANIIRYCCPIYYSWGSCAHSVPYDNLGKFYRDKQGEDLNLPASGNFVDMKRVLREAEPRLHETMWVPGFQYTHNGDFLSQWGGTDTCKFAFWCDGRGTGSLGRGWQGVGIVDGKWTFASHGTPEGFYFKKFINRVTAAGVDLYWPTFRLAELYLNYAEALNEYNPADPEILTYLNKVRVRGGLPALVPGNKTYDTCFGHLELMRECIHKERAVELYAEEHRPFDVRRWVIAGQDGVMKGDLKRLVVQQVDGVAYKDVRNAKMVPDFDSWTPEQKEANDRALSYKTEKSTTRVWEDKMYFYPFPTDEVNKGFLVQNPGWN
ncbi:MAG: RagB/SusD family nutrient uptake outer membrane protein [Alistipes sp.]|nr:RagB/SusD family nutrient uptake outer membrane protein [Alistipes sp.]